VFERGEDVGLCAIRFGVLDKDIAGSGERFRGQGLEMPGQVGLAKHVAQDSASVLSRDCSD